VSNSITDRVVADVLSTLLSLLVLLHLTPSLVLRAHLGRSYQRRLAKLPASTVSFFTSPGEERLLDLDPSTTSSLV
jgi:hypothetical protein